MQQDEQIASQSTVDAFKALSPDKQRAALAKMSPEAKQALLGGIKRPTMEQTVSNLKKENSKGLPAPPPPTARPESEEPSSAWEITKGLGRAAKNIGEAGIQLVKDQFDQNKPLGAVQGAVEGIGEGLYNADQATKASKAQGENLSGQLLADLENEPIIGEAVQRVEKAGIGKTAHIPVAGHNVVDVQYNLSPESLGAASEGAGYVLAPDVVKKGAEKGAGALKVGLQEAAGAGKEPVATETRARLERIFKDDQHYNEKVAATQKEYQEKLAEHEAKTKEMVENHIKAVEEAQHEFKKATDEYNKATADKKAEYKYKLDAAQKAWEQKAAEAERTAAEANKVDQQRESLVKGQKETSQKLHDNIKQTYTAVKESLDNRWDALRDKIGKDTPLNSDAVYHAIQEAEKEDLLGAPETVKQFKNIVNHIVTDGELIDTPGGATPRLKPLTWEAGKVHASAIGDALYSSDLPGNIQQGLKRVREAIKSELKKAADAKGAGEEYGKLNKDWSQFEDDWRNRKAVSSGGSILARAIKAPTSDFVKNWTQGTGGETVASKLERYKQFGGDPSLAENLRKMKTEVENLPKVKATKHPGKFAYPEPPPTEAEPPEMKQPKAPKFPEPPKQKGVEKPTPEPPVSAQDVRSRAIQQWTGHPYNWFNIFLPSKTLLKFDALREWVAKHPRNETPVSLPPKKGLPPPPPQSQ